MKVGYYISELLFEHESVILPGMGEFFTQYVPAKFIPEKQRVESPYKLIAFNPDKKEGGSILADYMAAKEQMSAEEVSSFLREFVEEVHQTLASGKQLKLVRVGIFSQGTQGNILFEPDRSVNYLEDTAGMESSIAVPEATEQEPETTPDLTETQETAPLPVSTEPVETEPPGEEPLGEETGGEEPPGKETGGAEEETAEAAPLPPAVHQGTPRALKWVAFTIVPLLVIIIILAFNFDYLFGKKQPAQPLAPETAEETISSPPSETAETTAQIPIEETEAAETPFDPSVPPPAPEAGRAVYHIIVGSFPDQGKAEDMARRLRSEEAPLAGVFMNTPQGFYRVSYGYYYDLKEAEALLEKVQSEINSEAWILHR